MLLYIKQMDSNLIALMSLLFTVLTTLFIIYLTILTLRFTAKPRLRVSLLDDRATGYYTSETITLKYLVENIGRWYGRPAAKNVFLYVNFDPAFEPFEIRFGTTLEKSNTTVCRGKRNCKYLNADGIHLTYQEPGEQIACTVSLPDKEGSYRSWIAAFSDEGDCGVHRFNIRIKKRKGRHT